MTKPNIEQYLESQADRQIEELIEWLRIPSISALQKHQGDVAEAAKWLAAQMRTIGLENVEVVETQGHPLVYGDWLGAQKGRPTVLIYGHYDVQPVEPVEKWTNPPFEPTIRDGKRGGKDIYARGAADDKGQVFCIIKALEALLCTLGELPVNVKLLIEGEEEIGSPSISRFIGENRSRLQADVCLISDTAIVSPDDPSTDYGLRGGWLGELNVRGPATDLHSGLYGGVIHNPNQALAEIIATMHDKEGRVAIDGFYDDVRNLDDTERQLLAKVPQGDHEIRQATGASRLYGEPGFSVVERIGARPTLEINGIWGGHIGEGFKTVIPSEAFAKISCRLVPHQDPDKIAKQLEQHIAKVAPPTINWQLKPIAGIKASLTDPEDPAMQAVARAYERGFGKAPVLSLGGGGIPVVSRVQDVLDIPVVLLGLALPDDNPHAPDERFHLPNFFKGIKTEIAFLEELAKNSY